MNCKFKNLSIFAISLATLLTACDKDNETPGTVDTYKIPAYNLYTSVSGSGGATVQLATYNFAIALPATTLKLYAPGLTIPGGASAEFATTELPLKVGSVKVEEEAREILSFSSVRPAITGSEISNLEGMLTAAVYEPPFLIDGFDRFVPSNVLHYAVMQYQINNVWQVRTFWPDVTFCGTTTTSMPSSANSFISDTPKYRVIMHLDRAASDYTADVIIYNAQFASTMPRLQAIAIKDLKLQFTQSGYEISATNVVPSMLESGQLIETPKFIFNQFNLTSQGDMTSANATYQVANMFSGRFTGDWLVK